MDASRSKFQRRLWLWQTRAAPYLFLLPFALMFSAFLLYPLLRSLLLSLFRSAGPRYKEFVGLGNYLFLLRDWLFWQALLNTFIFAILFPLLHVPLSLLLALLLDNGQIRFRKFFRFAFFSSYLLGNVFLAIIFILLLSPRQGLINKLIGALLPGVGTELNWRGDPYLALPALVMMSLWLSVGYGMIYLLAALQGVDQELYEAAHVDGAGRWKRFWHVTLPGIAPVVKFILLIDTIAAFQLFELPYVLFDPPTGPGMRGLTIVMYLYQQGFEAGNIGYAAAIGWVLVILIAIVAFAQYRVAKNIQEID